MKRTVVVTILLMCLASLAGADGYPRQPGVDAIHYVFRLDLLTSKTDEIRARAAVEVRFVADGLSEVFLDLTSPTADGKGMKVASVSIGGKPAAFIHAEDRLCVPLPSGSRSGQHVSFDIEYVGIPAEGLRCSEHWPNRARQWLPMMFFSQWLNRSGLPRLTGRRGTFAFSADSEPASVVLDPATWLLYEPGPFVRVR